jgi:hypothetical protein
MRVVALTLCVVACFSLLAASSATTSLNQQGTALFGSAWSPALGAWLPSYGDLDEPWRHGEATQIAQRDWFQYKNEKPGSPYAVGFRGPGGDGTGFVYGAAGPTRGHVVYDPVHRIAFFEQGCCSANEVVAAADVLPPPKHVVSRDLSDLSTVRGIRLGETPTAVMQIYGKSSWLQVAGHADLQMLAYTTWKPFKSLNTATGPCGQFQNFVFRQERLIYIGFGNGC